MGAKVSQEMLKAIELVKGGMSRYGAAKQAGVTLTGLLQSRLYLAWKAEQEAKAQQDKK